MKRLIASVLCAVPILASAGTMGIDLFSIHDASGFNNVNPGVYVTADNGLTAGVYYNSYRRTSVFAGYTVQSGPLALTLGAVHGYTKAPLLPMVVPSVRFGNVRASFIGGRLIGGGANAIHFSYEVNF